jgi:hypothetical protein
VTPEHALSGASYWGWMRDVPWWEFNSADLGHWRCFEAWCVRHSARALPAEPAVCAAYLEDLPRAHQKVAAEVIDRLHENVYSHPLCRPLDWFWRGGPGPHEYQAGERRSMPDPPSVSADSTDRMGVPWELRCRTPNVAYLAAVGDLVQTKPGAGNGLKFPLTARHAARLSLDEYLRDLGALRNRAVYRPECLDPNGLFSEAQCGDILGREVIVTPAQAVEGLPLARNEAADEKNLS